MARPPFRLSAAIVLATAVAACNSSTSDSSASDASTSADAAPACLVHGALPGASYDITKSRMAFGGKPAMSHLGKILRWMSADASLAILPNGYEGGGLSSTAPQANLPDLVPPNGATTASVVATYFETMGLESCQVAPSANEIPWEIGRSIQGISVVESIGQAVFDVDAQTTAETFYWPEIPADVVASAIAFREQLSDPSALEALKRKLPDTAQGDGAVVIHHTDRDNYMAPFQAVATYDVKVPVDYDGGDEEPPTSFDADGKPVTLPP